MAMAMWWWRVVNHMWRRVMDHWWRWVVNDWWWVVNDVNDWRRRVVGRGSRHLLFVFFETKHGGIRSSDPFLDGRVNNENSSSALSKLFFCDIEFSESQSSFAQFGVNALPHIRLLPPDATTLKTDSISMDTGDFSHLAESMGNLSNRELNSKWVKSTVLQFSQKLK
ncbi:unnamed protein product [Lactuca saligna]|uniref:Uncharacterized protein n=1 Tax=Lactuca saligna TaxID=75948 RepID=A0AA35ZIX9_LACSI|nr:unnamed protein product [Lactuca saligna]